MTSTKHLKENEMLLLSYLRKNARMSLTNLSRITKIPISTIYEKIRIYQKDLSLKTTAEFDFKKLGYPIKVFILIDPQPEKKEYIEKLITRSLNINSVIKINHNYNLFLECYFKSIYESEEFIENLRPYVKGISNHYVIKEMLRDSFLARPELVKMKLV